MTCGSLCAHWTTPEWLAGEAIRAVINSTALDVCWHQGQPRQADETSGMSALRLIAQNATLPSSALRANRRHAVMTFSWPAASRPPGRIQ